MKNIIRALSYLKEYKGKVALNILFTIVAALLEVVSLLSVIPFLEVIFRKNEVVAVKPSEAMSLSTIKDYIAYYVNDLIGNVEKVDVLKYICFFVVILFVLKNCFVFLNRYMSKVIRFLVATELRDRIYKKILSLPTSYYNDQKRGDVMTRFSNDISQLESSVLGSYELIFKEPVMILFYFISLLLINAQLTLFTLLLIPILGLIVARITKSLKKSSIKAQQRSSDLLSLLDETMLGAKILKSFTAESFFYQAFQSINQEYLRLEKRINKRITAASPLSEVMGITIVMVVLWYGGNLVLKDDSSFSGGMLIGFLIVFARLIDPLKSFSNSFSTLERGMASANRIDEFLATENPIKDHIRAVNKDSFQDRIVFQDIQFIYPNTEKPVLQNVSITVPKGKTIALVGQSGAGKSTFADLLPRFYDVTSGQIVIDDINIKEIKIKDLRKLISYVSQEAILFNDTIENNIRFGLKHVSREQVEIAAKMANAHDFILEQEQGYQTIVGERGGKLSGGQKQRITIARALLKNAPILVLDEATSALDTESERLVQGAIDQLLKNRTAIVIAHRLSTIKHADQIYVFNQGRVIETGNHDELIMQGGHYKKLTEMQAI